MKTQPEPLYYSADGVHPNENGRKFIGEYYAAAAEKLLK
jgi:lysophospholipase L1-like esterase